jgi:hypothetical protein
LRRLKDEASAPLLRTDPSNECAIREVPSDVIGPT